MQLRTKEYSVSIKSVDVAKREATFIASTSAIDSYEESIDQTSWRLERYRANPVVLFGHKSRELPIGTSVKTGLVGGNLEVVIRFATEKANPLAENVFQSVREGTLRAVSVGFVPNTIRSEMRDGKSITVLADCELHEISVVPIPANPEALAKMRAKGLDVGAAQGSARGAFTETANDRLAASALSEDDEDETDEEATEALTQWSQRAALRGAASGTSQRAPVPSMANGQLTHRNALVGRMPASDALNDMILMELAEEEERAATARRTTADDESEVL